MSLSLIWFRTSELCIIYLLPPSVVIFFMVHPFGYNFDLSITVASFILKIWKLTLFVVLYLFRERSAHAFETRFCKSHVPSLYPYQWLSWTSLLSCQISNWKYHFLDIFEVCKRRPQGGAPKSSIWGQRSKRSNVNKLLDTP